MFMAFIWQTWLTWRKKVHLGTVLLLTPLALRTKTLGLNTGTSHTGTPLSSALTYGINKGDSMAAGEHGLDLLLTRCFFKPFIWRPSNDVRTLVLLLAHTPLLRGLGCTKPLLLVPVWSTLGGDITVCDTTLLNHERDVRSRDKLYIRYDCQMSWRTRNHHTKTVFNDRRALLLIKKETFTWPDWIINKQQQINSR